MCPGILFGFSFPEVLINKVDKERSINKNLGYWEMYKPLVLSSLKKTLLVNPDEESVLIRLHIRILTSITTPLLHSYT